MVQESVIEYTGMTPKEIGTAVSVADYAAAAMLIKRNQT